MEAWRKEGGIRFVNYYKAARVEKQYLISAATQQEKVGKYSKEFLRGWERDEEAKRRWGTPPRPLVVS